MLLQVSDEFVVWTRRGTADGSHRAARVLVGPPGVESLRLAVSGEADCRPFPEPLLWVLPLGEAQALVDGCRAGGTAADDAP